MERNNLKELDGNRVQLTARVGKFDKAMGFAGPQRIVELKNIQLFKGSNPLFDSLWLNCGKWSSILKEHNNIIFDARINLSKKQKLERITKVSLFEPQIKDVNNEIEDLIKKSLNYGKNLWESTETIDQIIIEIENLGTIIGNGQWMDHHSKSLELLACKLVFLEWNSKRKNILSRLHEFIVWLKLIIDEHIKDIDPLIKKEFYRYCMEQWFYFYQGE